MVPDRTRRPGKWGGFSCALPQVNLDVAECFCGQHSWSAAILPEMTLTVFLSRRYAVVAALFAASVAGCSPATETSVQVQGRALFIAGTLDHGAKPLILGALDANPQVDTLAFTVNPGSVDDACTIDLGREIRRRGLSTRLAGDGALVSGGLTLFLSGASRTLEGPATIGVHAWQGCSGKGEDASVCVDAGELRRDDPRHRLHADYVREMLGSEDFYWFSIQAAPSWAVHWLSGDDVARFGIADRHIEGARLQVPPAMQPAVLRPKLCRNCPAPADSGTGVGDSPDPSPAPEILID